MSTSEPGIPLDYPRVERVRRYIRRTWRALLRSEEQWLRSAVDPKVSQGGKLLLYLPPGEDVEAVARRLRRAAPDATDRLDVRPLPADPSRIREHGLLYLPHPYVVPGGRFNEMYGWDSYFIVVGLLHDGEVELARWMTDNQLYQIIHYGKVLNANRTYYLTRSQPPFVSRMVLDVFRHTGDAAWLADSVPALERYHAYWVEESHLTPVTGLSRYHGGVAEPAPEVELGERDAEGRSHYDRVRAWFRERVGRGEDVSAYYDATVDALTPLFFLSDRAMRESGFDPSNRFGPFSADCIHYNPVDLNCLLYAMEMDLAAIHTLLGHTRQASEWSRRAAWRAERIRELMWDPHAGLFFDYQFVEQRRSSYRFITTFYPLWAGIATEEQAARVVENLPIFEREGGLQTSDQVTGNQWDAPFGWAPTHIIAVEGLRRYGYRAEAERIARKFLALILDDFEAHGTIREKYDVVTRTSDVADALSFGYTSNEDGFGWTNAAFVHFLALLTA
ncbi:MAG: hypothetical protein Kow0047_26500 [Anaerolineae bacterium]